MVQGPYVEMYMYNSVFQKTPFFQKRSRAYPDVSLWGIYNTDPKAFFVWTSLMEGMPEQKLPQCVKGVGVKEMFYLGETNDCISSVWSGVSDPPRTPGGNFSGSKWHQQTIFDASHPDPTEMN